MPGRGFAESLQLKRVA